MTKARRKRTGQAGRECCTIGPSSKTRGAGLIPTLLVMLTKAKPIHEYY